MSIFAGFDAGISSPGLGVVTRLPAGYRLEAHRVVRTKPRDTLEARCRLIFQAIAEVLTTWHPLALVIEEQRGAQVGAFQRGQFNADNSKTLVTVGVAMGAAFAYGIPVVLLTPKRGKLAVCGPKMGNADKKQVQDAVFRITGAKVPQDAADATAFAIAGSQLHPTERVRRQMAEPSRGRRPTSHRRPAAAG